jgi:hypothetical protein
LEKVPASQVPVPESALPKPSSSTGCLPIIDSTKSVIVWALKVVESHYSYRSCAGIDKIFRLMFPNCEEACNFSCGPTKCSYICCFGLAPHFKSILVQKIKDNRL